jgi:hypothetical protein
MTHTKLRVFWTRNIGSVPPTFLYHEVDSVDDGLKVLIALARMDFQDIGVQSNMGGLEYLLPEDQQEESQWHCLSTERSDRELFEEELVDLKLKFTKGVLDEYYG